MDRLIKSQSEKYLTLELAYDTKLKGTNNTEYYDGSLSAMAWETKSQKRHTYSFGYDGWKNLCKASSDDHPYTAQYQYDENGNLSFLSRNDSLGLYQRFLYGYENTNQLRKLDRTNTEKVEVWPGDANNDGKVDVDDQHPVGYNYQFTVKPRDTLGTEWKDYLVIRRKGDQMVFSDTNGDGLINETDTSAIHQNLLKEHKLTEALETNGFRYEYDDNGNMVKDEYKKISISYNILNLPDTISATGQGKIVNQYLADGTLLRRSIFDADDNEVQRIDYQGEFLFVNNQLDKIFTEEGYYSELSPPTPSEGGENAPASGKGKYYYTLADHLGHTRVVVDQDENVIQETAYYPYGTPIAALSSETKYNYLYTGKEFLENFGLNWYDHHARYFDPEVGRWWAIDPALQSASPYMAMGNNPMMYIDADGKTWNPFKAIGQAWNWAWYKANQFAQWADQVGIPSVNIGYGMSSSGQIQPVGDINGHPLFSNESQYEAASQNAVNAINDARGEYFSQQNMHRGFDQKINKTILRFQPTNIININSVMDTRPSIAIDETYMAPQINSRRNNLTADVMNEFSAINTLYTAYNPNRVTPKIGWLFTGVGAYNNIKSGAYPEAMWTVIEGAGGAYALGIRGVYYVSQTNYVQSEIGRMAYRNFQYNIQMYNLTKNDKFFERASKAQETMRTSYYNLIRKK